MAKAATVRPPPPSPAAQSRRVLVTPEGVDLGVELASHGARAGAFMIDMSIMLAILIFMSILAGLMGANLDEEGGGGIIFMLVSFLLREAWFTLWEMTPKAATPGKRMMRIRVAMRSGGRLTPDAIIARNLTRELEVFLPLTALFSTLGPALGFTGIGGALAVIAGLLWCSIFVLMPLFNRDRLRVGDLIGGTWVVEAPRPKLEPDLAADAHEHVHRFTFSKEQVDAYGEKELHVLEEVIRRYDKRIAADVARRIRDKIRWEGDEPDMEFLRAYYAALRRKLEQGMLFGKRKKDKFDKKV